MQLIFGIPQNRERLFIVCSLDKLNTIYRLYCKLN